jgi:hypothetical protein
MDTQLVVIDEGVERVLDVFETQPIKLNLSFEDLVDTAVTSNYSQTFRLPQSDANYLFFQTAFDVDGYDFDVTKKVSSVIRINGLEFVKGHLRLLKIYKRESDYAEYECVFMGEVRDFAGKLGSKTLSDIDFSDYVHALTYANVTASWAATPDTTNGLMNGDIVYPLVNFGNTYTDGIPDQPVMQVGNTYGFTSSTRAIEADRFKPIVRMPEVFRRIMDEAGFEYESNFLASELARKMYVTAWGNEANISPVQGSANNFNAEIGSNFILSSQTVIQYNNELQDYGDNYNPTTYKFTAPVNGNYTFNVVLNGDIRASLPVHDFDIEIVKNTTIIHSDSFSGDLQEIPFTYARQQSTALLAGDEVFVRYSPTTTGEIVLNTTGSKFQCIDSTGNIDVSAEFDSEYKQVDFIKDIMTLFHLVMVPHPYDQDKFVIEPFEQFVNAKYHEDDPDYNRVWDITDKVDYDKDVVIEPIFYTQKQEIEFKYNEDKDWLNELNDKEFKETFGTLKANSDNELLSGKREVKVSLAPTPVTQIDYTYTTGAGMGNTIIPHILTKDVEGATIVNKPVKAKTRLLFFNGIKFCGLGVDYDQSVWYFKDDSDIPQGFDYYPRVSPYQEYPISPNALDLNWQRERGYALYPIATGSEQINGLSLYDNYWAGYIQGLYDKWARKVTVTAYLTQNDLTYPTFYWDKIVRLKGSYYRLDKIEGFNVNQPDFCKLTLIKLEAPNLDYVTQQQLLWNTWTDLPNLDTELWGSLTA